MLSLIEFVIVFGESVVGCASTVGVICSWSGPKVLIVTESMMKGGDVLSTGGRIVFGL